MRRLSYFLHYTSSTHIIASITISNCTKYWLCCFGCSKNTSTLTLDEMLFVCTTPNSQLPLQFLHKLYTQLSQLNQFLSNCCRPNNSNFNFIFSTTQPKNISALHRINTRQNFSLSHFHKHLVCNHFKRSTKTHTSTLFHGLAMPLHS